MRELKRLSLHNLSQAEIAKKRQSLLKGGSGSVSVCLCGCRYAGGQSGPDDSYYGGSSDIDNGDANADKGLYS
ncbi:TIGR04149 family rSAM-modified RiPP [Parabacteroides hominis]|uniref:RSAM-modified peptide n=1 Tax=Parabacteroides hominis TaxID=2763057 RepID=A0ABR7DQF3_9BACT|nr:TIGR04149 family rSAM-modified RiPP [Parabacteroides hominis]MBC5632933.1 rSAM-modified peptide [Parabacteroides hominis]